MNEDEWIIDENPDEEEYIPLEITDALIEESIEESERWRYDQSILEEYAKYSNSEEISIDSGEQFDITDDLIEESILQREGWRHHEALLKEYESYDKSVDIHSIGGENRKRGYRVGPLVWWLGPCPHT